MARQRGVRRQGHPTNLFCDYLRDERGVVTMSVFDFPLDEYGLAGM